VAAQPRERIDWPVIGFWVVAIVGSWALVAAIAYGIYELVSWLS
jgi:hypothetical protein